MVHHKSRGWGIKATGWGVTLGLLGLTLAGEASAGCMDNPSRQGSPAKPVSATGLIPAIYRPTDAWRGSFLRVGATEYGEASIVGLWEFKFAGFATDWGTQAWHSDGTELMFSGSQNPETGDVCQGVWRQVGRSTYTLNHIAMGWMAPGGPFGTRVHFHVIVKLDPSGKTFSGTYKAAAYSVSPTDPFDESVELGSGTGTLTATRVNPD